MRMDTSLKVPRYIFYHKLSWINPQLKYHVYSDSDCRTVEPEDEECDLCKLFEKLSIY